MIVILWWFCQDWTSEETQQVLSVLWLVHSPAAHLNPTRPVAPGALHSRQGLLLEHVHLRHAWRRGEAQERREHRKPRWLVQQPQGRLRTTTRSVQLLEQSGLKRERYKRREVSARESNPEQQETKRQAPQTTNKSGSE